MRPTAENNPPPSAVDPIEAGKSQVSPANELETGRPYKLVLHNPSPQKDDFSSDGLAGAVYTRI
jgi:hypothetical protein